MTTAHRPTYNASRGGEEQGGNKLYIPSKMYSSKDLPSNLQLKSRRSGQGTTRDLKGKDFKREILQREHQNLKEKRGLGLVSSIYEDIDIESNDINDTIDFTSDLPQIDAPKKKQKTEEESNLEDISRISNIKQEGMKDSEVVFPQDKDYEYESDDDKSDHNGERITNLKEHGEDDNQQKEESSSFSSEDEDSEEELYRELEKIKKMREEQNRQKELEHMEKNKIQIQEDIIKGNPLLSHSGYSLKKKWFEDTVFKNQAKNEVKTKKRFINDTVRSDFHRKFLAKTMQ